MTSRGNLACRVNIDRVQGGGRRVVFRHQAVPPSSLDPPGLGSCEGSGREEKGRRPDPRQLRLPDGATENWKSSSVSAWPTPNIQIRHGLLQDVAAVLRDLSNFCCSVWEDRKWTTCFKKFAVDNWYKPNVVYRKIYWQLSKFFIRPWEPFTSNKQKIELWNWIFLSAIFL